MPTKRSVLITATLILVSGIFTYTVLGLLDYVPFPGQIDDDDDYDPDTEGRYTVQATIEIKIANKLADDAAIGGIAVRFYDLAGVLYGTSTTDASGYVTSDDQFWSGDDIVVVVGTLGNGTYEPQRFDITMPKSHDEDDSSVYYGKLRFSPVATAAQISSIFYRTGSTSALTSYNITTSGNVLEGYVSCQITTQDRAVRDIWDYSEWVNEEMNVYFMMREQNNTAVEAVDYAYMSYEDQNTLSHVLILEISSSEFAYDLDSQGKIIEDGYQRYTYKYDFSSCSTGSNQTEFYMEYYLIIGCTGVLTSGAAPGDVLLEETATVPILV